MEYLAQRTLDHAAAIVSAGSYYDIGGDAQARNIFLRSWQELCDHLGRCWGTLTGRSSHGVYLPDDLRPYHFLATVATTAELNGITGTCLCHIVFKYALEVWRCVKRADPTARLRGFSVELPEAAFPTIQTNLRAFPAWDYPTIRRLNAEITQEVRRAAVRVPGVVADMARVAPAEESETSSPMTPIDPTPPAPAAPGDSPPLTTGNYTLGQLVAVLDSIEQHRGFRLLNHQDQLRRNPISAVMNRIYEQGLAWRPDEAQMPGISRIELLCDRQPGEAGITAAKVRRLRADICDRRQWRIPQADQLSLNEAADVLEGVHRVSLAELQAAQQQQLHHGLATLDHIQVGVEPGQVVQVTGLSCKVVRGPTPTACPNAHPVLPPSLLGAAERAVRRLYTLPAGATIHWVGHDTGTRSRCVCPEYRDAPFAAPFDQHRWASIPQPPPPPPPPRTIPVWDGTARRLMFGERVCKQFKKPAPDQEKVLATFQEDGWPDGIDAPLPDAKLSRTVESLNDRLQHIRFSLNGAGTGIVWQPI